MSENNQNPGVHSGSNDKQKRAKFRELARHDRITIASRFADDYAQLFLPFMTDCLADVQRQKRDPGLEV
jgi:hypothetical protein